MKKEFKVADASADSRSNVATPDPCRDQGVSDLPLSVIRIPLSKGMFALVDAKDAASISRLKWYAIIKPKTAYAMTSIMGKNLFMHRFILKAPDGMAVDHIDHDGLNNTRENIRIASHSQNNANKNKRAGTSSKYKGVSFRQSKNKWCAQIEVAGKCYWLGSFDSEWSAALAYNVAACKHFGEFALINEAPRG